MSKDNLPIEELAPGDYVAENYKIKIIVVGDSGVGKTNLINRFATDKFDTNSKATIGVEFVYKTLKIGKEVIKVEVWDTAGQERYRSITSSYYKGARGAIIVYDITNDDSFHNVKITMSLLTMEWVFCSYLTMTLRVFEPCRFPSGHTM